MLPMWGKRVPTVLNDRFSNFQAGNQVSYYPYILPNVCE